MDSNPEYLAIKNAIVEGDNGKPRYTNPPPYEKFRAHFPRFQLKEPPSLCDNSPLAPQQQQQQSKVNELIMAGRSLRRNKNKAKKQTRFDDKLNSLS